MADLYVRFWYVYGLFLYLFLPVISYERLRGRGRRRREGAYSKISRGGMIYLSNCSAETETHTYTLSINVEYSISPSTPFLTSL